MCLLCVWFLFFYRMTFSLYPLQCTIPVCSVEFSSILSYVCIDMYLQFCTAKQNNNNYSTMFFLLQRISNSLGFDDHERDSSLSLFSQTTRRRRNWIKPTSVVIWRCTVLLGQIYKARQSLIMVGKWLNVEWNVFARVKSTSKSEGTLINEIALNLNGVHHSGL